MCDLQLFYHCTVGVTESVLWLPPPAPLPRLVDPETSTPTTSGGTGQT